MRRRLRIAAAVVVVAVALVAAWACFPFGAHVDLNCHPPDNARCQKANGRVLYVEATDPDGDGDMHVVLASRRSFTWPGVTVLVIPHDERPSGTPHFGEWVSAVGLPTTGSHGEATLNALRFDLGGGR
jgi:hypothetical protein